MSYKHKSQAIEHAKKNMSDDFIVYKTSDNMFSYMISTDVATWIDRSSYEVWEKIESTTSGSTSFFALKKDNENELL